MSSASKPTRKTRTIPAKKIAEKTSPPTPGSSPSSIDSKPGAVRLLIDFAAAADGLGLEWYVFGAQAAVAYGQPRMTADVDVTVALGETTTLAFLDALSRNGFSLRGHIDEDSLLEARLLPLLHRKAKIPADVMLASTRLHAELIARRRWIDVGGIVVPMLSPEDLIVTKVLAGRRKDLEDVRGVLLAQSNLDLERARDLLGEMELALGDTRLLRRLERLIRQVQ